MNNKSERPRPGRGLGPQLLLYRFGRWQRQGDHAAGERELKITCGYFLKIMQKMASGLASLALRPALVWCLFLQHLLTLQPWWWKIPRPMGWLQAYLLDRAGFDAIDH